jgi:flagellar motor switch protein FliN
MSDPASENLNPSPATAEAVSAPASEAPAEGVEGIDAELSSLPTYARGLMRIRVPVQVMLASQRKSIQEIIELGPGSIIKFDKTCDEPLELYIGERPIAQGEVVKVGDKFGLKISGLVK